ncbi:MAG: hypothetical protein WBY69_23935, partial [Candidatus Acidiferrales bacterium]
CVNGRSSDKFDGTRNRGTGIAGHNNAIARSNTKSFEGSIQRDTPLPKSENVLDWRTSGESISLPPGL